MTKNKGCLDCKIRHINCHDDCERYKNFKKELKTIKDKKKKDNFIIPKTDRRNLRKI